MAVDCKVCYGRMRPFLTSIRSSVKNSKILTETKESVKKNISDNGLKTSKIDAFSPLYEVESALQCALETIEVTESQDEK